MRFFSYKYIFTSYSSFSPLWCGFLGHDSHTKSLNPDIKPFMKHVVNCCKLSLYLCVTRFCYNSSFKYLCDEVSTR
jgi:hypothetical protein